ncbi:tripartite tricarboxylate transporter TctB family protein [Vibrio spartinae]|uniref:Tripartite tricarboxylate transporter TctB family protein n=1 Tax=Vibrio spartinae TaxID=1918945 RepID=A0ABX6R1C1_9VIBR|nr:tripartite tricarboxylate transporter TctB family protein [Vibrio spartinae]QMV14982.1 Tripartite tricarboxylate transporter TctB family protein [Vibrio spartinae]
MRSLPLSQFIIGIFSLLILITSIQQYGGISAYGAGYMPTILSAFLLLFTVLDAVIHLRQRPEKLQLTAVEIRALLLIIVSIGLFTFLISYLGFLICATGLLFGLMSLRHPKKIFMNMVFSVLSSGIIYYVFGHILMVALPEGFWS